MYMRRTQLYLDEGQRRVLERLSLETGKSLGQLVREAVDAVYCRARAAEGPLSNRDPIWKFIGGGESRESDVSAMHDRYLYGTTDEDLR
jgi:hypothetical protein